MDRVTPINYLHPRQPDSIISDRGNVKKSLTELGEWLKVDDGSLVKRWVKAFKPRHGLNVEYVEKLYIK
jgi:hypothetical protein